MALNDNFLLEGIDPTSTFGGYASVLLQLVRNAVPSSTYGAVLFDSSTPVVSGSYAWRKRCVWLDQTNPASPVVKVYRSSGSPGWVSITDVIPANSITTAMIQDAAVTLAKLSTAGGAALQLIRVNAGVSGFEFVNASDLFAASSLPVSRLDTSAFGIGDFRIAGGEFGSGGGLWYSVDTALNHAGPACLPANAIVAPTSFTGNKSQFLGVNVTGTEPTFRDFNPTDDIDDGSVSGVKLADNTIAVSKLIPGSEGQVLSVTGGVPVWVSSSPITPTTFQEDFKFDTGNIDSGVAFNKDIALTLPASRNWKDIEIFVYFTNSGGGATTAKAELKWNTAPETGVVSVSSTAGAGQSSLTLAGGATGWFRWKGVVPSTIKSTNITFRIAVTLTGAGIVSASRYELTARATGNV